MLKFPLAILDFEASSLSNERSYPIEAGLAIATGTDAPIRLWSSLIKPTADWIADGDWSAKSQSVHGISPRDLDAGLSPAEVATGLNERVTGIPQVWCDGGEYDAYWLHRLFDAARIAPAFRLCDVAGLFVFNRQYRNPFASALAETVASHRAGADAERICTALVQCERSTFSP